MITSYLLPLASCLLPFPKAIVGWAKFYNLEYSKKPNCFCPPYKLFPTVQPYSY
ncbi:MAG: hypothetical protein F6J90_35410 [Moorea sp. SIOASIH]|uniref:hypothetical protein n=1 Tax=Moorena sp. SIOASIH TaxID=2607817 RepID=UPI0013B82AE5|nr:hypothetical protein [Moorena sp. SIOASIH]NEO41332.1 hypothetical protein [Moorena sp. SIOASIH]